MSKDLALESLTRLNRSTVSVDKVFRVGFLKRVMHLHVSVSVDPNRVPPTLCTCLLSYGNPLCFNMKCILLIFKRFGYQWWPNAGLWGSCERLLNAKGSTDIKSLTFKQKTAASREKGFFPDQSENVCISIWPQTFSRSNELWFYCSIIHFMYHNY